MTNRETYPMVSIILPTYNRAGYILEAIESIRRQTLKDWELLIMDDGSDDDTEERLKGITDERILYHKLPKTGKVSRIKNMAMEKCRAELIAFIDSDDLWAPFKLEKQVSALKQY